MRASTTTPLRFATDGNDGAASGQQAPRVVWAPPPQAAASSRGGWAPTPPPQSVCDGRAPHTALAVPPAPPCRQLRCSQRTAVQRATRHRFSASPQGWVDGWKRSSSCTTLLRDLPPIHPFIQPSTLRGVSEHGPPPGACHIASAPMPRSWVTCRRPPCGKPQGVWGTGAPGSRHQTSRSVAACRMLVRQRGCAVVPARSGAESRVVVPSVSAAGAAGPLGPLRPGAHLCPQVGRGVSRRRPRSCSPGTGASAP